MRSLVKDRGNKELNFEADLLISAEDIAFMEQNHVKSDPDLEAYLYFLEEIGAFESKNVKPVFFHEEFEL